MTRPKTTTSLICALRRRRGRGPRRLLGRRSRLPALIRTPSLRHDGGAAAGSLIRKMPRTSAGAATKSTIRACSTSVSSFGVPARACIASPPTLSAPKSSPASTVPSGLRAAEQGDGDGVEADRCRRQRRAQRVLLAQHLHGGRKSGQPPATAPSRACRPLDTLMPAVRDASGLAPTARSSKPQVLRSSSHQTATRGEDREDDAEVHVKPSPSARERRGVVDRRRERVVAAGPLEGVLAQERRSAPRRAR